VPKCVDLAELLGVSRAAVSQAIKAGRIPPELVIRNKEGNVVGLTDLQAAADAYRQNTDYSTAPKSVVARLAPASPGEDDSLAEANRQEKLWKAKLAELKYKREAGELLPAHDVESRLTSVFTECKTKLLGVPSRARQALPHLSAADITELERLVREALEGLAS
jgi:phage terminase Nu1 subunit (DNA packaging protein)